MRCLNRNRSKFWYAKFLGMTPLTDEYGNKTGEYEVLYTEPIEAKANISSATGEVIPIFPGSNPTYDKVLVFEPMLNYDIDENSILWIDKEPSEGSHDYVVKRVAKNLNSTAIALSKVNVHG